MNLMENCKKLNQSVLSRKNKYECRSNHIQSVTEPFQPTHPPLKRHILRFIRKKGNEDCQKSSQRMRVICSHKFSRFNQTHSPFFSSHPQRTTRNCLHTSLNWQYQGPSYMGRLVHMSLTHQTGERKSLVNKRGKVLMKTPAGN